MRALRAALDEAAAGHSSLWLVAGEAGIGKTRLVGELEAAATGFTVLRGESLEFGGDALALGPVVSALRGHGGLPRAEGADALFELLLGQLGREAEDAPVLLILEDIHWADQATLALLAFLAANLRAERIVVVATYRVDDELSPAVRRLVRELVRRRTVTRTELRPLTLAEVAQLAEGLAGGPVDQTVAEELHRRSGGNPFFVEELFAVSEPTLEEAVLARVARLDAGLLHLLAAAGGRTTHALLERLAVAPEAVRAALDAGVLVRDRDGVAFRHGLIGEVLYERLLPVQRSALHRRIADQLEDAAQRAHHCHRAGMPAEALAASLEAGADAAAVFAYDAALLHYERALALGARDAEVLARAAQAARFAGATEKAVVLCREAIERTDDHERQAHLYERLGEYHFWDDEAALACYDRALALAPDQPRLLAARGHALMGLRRWEESRACCEAALAAGAGPRITLGVVLAYLGEPEAGEAHLRDALDLAATGEETARTYLHLGELLRVRGDYAGALEAMLDGEREAALLGLRSSFGRFMFVNAADDLLRLGRWEEAEARLAEAARLDLSRTAAALRRATAGLLHALRGELDTARGELGDADDDGLPSEFVAPLAIARATLALAEEDQAAARAHIASALAGVQDPLYTPPLYSLALRVEAQTTERARRPIDTAAADAHLAALNRLLAGPAAPPGALAHRALAEAEHARAHGAASGPLWLAAATAFEALREPYPTAYARVQAAAALLAAGDRHAAHAALTAAHATAAALGARPLLDEARTLARRARLPLAAPVAPSVNGDGTDLTRREVEVVRLLADGLTNREIAKRLFISEKTVSAHVAHIYSKLDVHSRVAAAARVHHLGVLEKPPEG